MFDLNDTDILTRVNKYNLIRVDRMIHIDIHERLAGNLAGNFIAVPNLITVIAKSEHQGVGDTEEEALKDCLEKIKNVTIEELFPAPAAPPRAQKEE